MAVQSNPEDDFVVNENPTPNQAFESSLKHENSYEYYSSSELIDEQYSQNGI